MTESQFLNRRAEEMARTIQMAGFPTPTISYDDSLDAYQFDCSFDSLPRPDGSWGLLWGRIAVTVAGMTHHSWPETLDREIKSLQEGIRLKAIEICQEVTE